MPGISIISRCPVCKGKGKIPKEIPFEANPKAPPTRADKIALVICPECKGIGIVGLL
ncbi:MAG: hypothetical protein PHE15_05555 [Dehalococcoidales bacterium]|nr:hypothetical protein [Dehalococcoidales bacterium]